MVATITCLQEHHFTLVTCNPRNSSEPWSRSSHRRAFSATIAAVGPSSSTLDHRGRPLPDEDEQGAIRTSHSAPRMLDRGSVGCGLPRASNGTMQITHWGMRRS
jgi:hypothetical protein